MCLVSLEGGGKFEITQAKYRLSEEQKQEDGQRLFDFCGECLKAFIDTNQETGLIPKNEILPLGFTVRRVLAICDDSTDLLPSSHTHARKSPAAQLLRV